jgi:predicted dehydrogenase
MVATPIGDGPENPRPYRISILHLVRRDVVAKRSLLIVGVGSIGERHLRCFQQTGRAQTAICEIHEALRRSIAHRYGVESSFSSIDEALQTPFDGVVVATPANFHIPIAVAAAKSGIHLLIEKPLSTTDEGLAELLHVCGAGRVVAGVAYVMRHNPALAAARAAIHSGQFGRLLQVVTVSGQNFPFYRPAYRDTYYADRRTGGGAIQDALTHFVNAVEWIAGPATQVIADAAHLSIPGVEVEDTVHVLARHGSVMAAYTLNQHQQPNESTITLICERGVVRVAVHENAWSSAVDPQGKWTRSALPSLERDDLFIAQANNFLDAIEGRAQIACSLAEGAATLNSNLAILRAADNAPWVATSSPRE